MRRVFTTGQAARVCAVAPRTVSLWFDRGLLGGYRVPGGCGRGTHRRIPREALVKFLRDHGMPLGLLEGEGWHKVLVVGAGGPLVGQLRRLLPDDDCRCAAAADGFEAGIMAESFYPDTIIIDLALGRSEAVRIAASLRRDARYGAALIVALANEDEADPGGLVAGGFSESFRKPFDVALLAERIRAAAAAVKE
jgi:two-component system response regulator RpaA